MEIYQPNQDVIQKDYIKFSFIYLYIDLFIHL